MARDLSEEEFRLRLDALRSRMERYAQLLVSRGINVQPGQELVVTAPVEAYGFVRMVASAGYEAGAGHVTTIWTDDALSRLNYENVSPQWFDTVPNWMRAQRDDLAAEGAGFLWLDGDDPDGLMGIDHSKVAAWSRAVNTQCTRWRHGLDFGENAWCIGGVPTQKWAQKVFGDLSGREALLALWEAILDVARVTDDPKSAWETHNAMLEKNKKAMNRHRFSGLRYKASNGTDLTVRLNTQGLWDGGSAATQDGVRFFPNIPTEEVFTTPDRLGTQGIVHSALPLVHNGSVVRDFWLRFEDGQVKDYGAAEGAEILESILSTDKGARYLGECALISKNTPIRESGLLFYNTLYDENASCHLALGMGFPECYEGGFDMTADELSAAGVNQSAQHVDFMIGTDDLDIWGITAQGEEIPVFVHGQWAWE